MHRPQQLAAGRTLTIDGKEVSTADYDVRLVVAGSRGYHDYQSFSRIISAVYTFFNQPVLFISGDAKSGGDALIIQWCEEQEILCAKFPADWDGLGKRAGYVRNAEMAAVATHLIAFWDGVSKGTKHMIDICQAKGLLVHVVLIDSDTTRPEAVRKRINDRKALEYREAQSALLEGDAGADSHSAQAAGIDW